MTSKMQPEEDAADQGIPLGFANLIPVKGVGAGISMHFFYHNMRRTGSSLESDRDISVPSGVLKDTFEDVLQRPIPDC